MGQQQLILLVLATVIVGLATVVGIRAFAENSDKSNADAMMQDAVRIANDLQAWKKKPAAFGGQGDNTLADNNFTGATLAKLGYKVDGSDVYTNLNGKFTLSGVGANPLLTGTSLDASGEEQVIEVKVCGPEDTDVVGSIRKIAGQDADAAPTCP